MKETGQLYVLCDTNAAAHDSFLFLKRGGPEVIAMLRAKQVKLLVPEVLRAEYATHFVEIWAGAVKGAEKLMDKLEDLAGYKMLELIPASEYGQARALQILEQLEDVIHSVPLSDELMLAAGRRSMKGLAPTSKSDHGLKDCLIWESVLSLPKGSEVIFVSRDKLAFFEGDVLATELKKDAEAKGLYVSAINTAKPQSLWPLVDALKGRYSDIADLALDDVPMEDHPMIRAYTQATPAEPLIAEEVISDAPNNDAHESGEIDLELMTQTRQLFDADIKALGLVTYLKSIDKRTVVAMLERLDVAKGVAYNALERLSLAGLIKDTGNHYLAAGGRLADLAASQVEANLIELLEQRND